jgi:hypothetical protein
MRVGLLWRREWDPPQARAEIAATCKLHGVFAAFARLGVAAEPVVYADDAVDDIRNQVLELDGVLVWVNPIEQGLDRSRLDTLLREVAAAGVWVSAHPDVIMRMATKQVLVDTRSMSWGTDTRLYRSAGELHEQLRGRVSDRAARVLKQERGMGGQGIWKVELDTPDDDPWLLVQEAVRESAPERLRLGAFVDRCKPYFANDGLMVEQPFQERIADGLIRVYLTHDTVVGFAHQYPSGLRPASSGEPPPGKTFKLASAEEHGELRTRMESEWLPEMKRLLDLHTHALPVIWDADFLYGPATATGSDTFVLCEINASSTFAFPDHAMPTVAAAALERIADNKRRRQARGSVSRSSSA